MVKTLGCHDCGRTGFATARGLRQHQGSHGACAIPDAWICVCKKSFVKRVSLVTHQQLTGCKGSIPFFQKKCRVQDTEEDASSSALPQLDPNSIVDGDGTLSQETLRRRRCVRENENVPIFPEAPEMVDESVSMRYLQQQVMDAVVAQMDDANLPAAARKVDKLEAQFLAIAEKW
jgi:hypothetical protein